MCMYPKMHIIVSDLSVNCQWDIRVASRARRVGGSLADATLTST